MSELLEQINSPDDLKKLDTKGLTTLADEIRQFIISSVSRTGGHLASNLGVVELTLALHYVFDFKIDKLFWDVGHQCYTHKIITGRRASFSRLRHEGGTSGFPDPLESVYDQFFVGHAGTAIPTAIGMALGQVQKHQTGKIVALVGDASIVNGVAFEALNNIGLVNRQLLVVLNDNSMAIDPSQGMVAKYFSKVRLSHTYEDLRRTTSTILEHMPVIGKSVEEAVEKIKKSIRMVFTASQMFESLNIAYFGPVDGHDITSLVQLFKALAHLQRPAILHVYTKKGKGFGPAEDDRRKYHSTGPFETNGEAAEPLQGTAAPGGIRKTTPRPASHKELPTFTSVLGQHLVYLAAKNNQIVAITSAMCDGTGLTGFRSRFPNRFYDVGIAESAGVDIAAGLAKSGCKPVICVYSTFLQRAYDQIFQEVALQNLPVVFCIDRAGLVGPDGPTHHGLMDIGFMRMMPNMVLIAPADETEVRLALEFALALNRPVCMRYPKDKVPGDASDKSACLEPFKLGKSVVVRKNSKANIAIVTYGSLLSEALGAAELLAKEKIEAEVINARFATPIDKGIVHLLTKGKAIITVEDHAKACGFGSALLELVAHTPKPPSEKPILVLGVENAYIKHNSRSAQLMEAGLNADKIAQAAKNLIK